VGRETSRRTTTMKLDQDLNIQLRMDLDHIH